MIRVSRSAITARKNCEQSRYWMTEHQLTADQPVRGITKAQEMAEGRLALHRGKLLHGIAQRMHEGREWHQYLADQVKLFSPSQQELQSTLIRRAMLGWHATRGQHFYQHFDIMSMEKEWTWKMGSGVEEPLRLDQVLRAKDDGSLGILDFKTLSQVDINWVKRMEIDDQTMLYVQALKETSGEWVMGIIYEGIIIGKRKDEWHHSPFVMGYRQKGGRVVPHYGYGWDKVSLLDYSDDAWLKWAQQTQCLNELYCTTGWINPLGEHLIQRKQSTVEAELVWYGKMEQIRQAEGEQRLDLMNKLVERNDKWCLKFGSEYACQYYDLCWRQHDPKMGYQEREDHHENE